MASEDEHAKPIINGKLALLSSPVVTVNEKTGGVMGGPGFGDLPDLSQLGDRPGPLLHMPEFQRHEEAGNLELFFDLFFAANYTVFSQNQSVTSSTHFQAYVGYFSLLWINWFLVGLYDVRFLTDSFFERACRGVHLGVMVGFAVVAPHFDPTDQVPQTMRTMSIILFVSRLCLSIEYGSILWHIRKFKRARLPMYLQIGLTFIASVVYLGIAFRFRDGNSRVFITWYIASGMELILTIGISNLWEVLSFTKTHLMKRMSLLTIIFLGDSIITIGTNVARIVHTPDAWNSTVIGIVTAATATVYFMFLVYFDWMRYSHLPAWRQQLWTVLHYPFHLAVIIFSQGFTQFIIWAKAVDVLENLNISSILDSPEALAAATSEQMEGTLQKVIDDFTQLYPFTYYDSWTTVNDALANVTELPDEIWPIAAGMDPGASADSVTEEDLNLFVTIFTDLFVTMHNSLFENLGIDLQKEIASDNPDLAANLTAGDFQITVAGATWERYQLMFSLGYVAGGITLFIMVVLAILSQVRPWRPWPLARAIINMLLAVGLGLVATLYYSTDKLENYLVSPWLLPTICLVWFTVLVLTHVHNAPSPLSLSQNRDAIFNWPKPKPQAKYGTPEEAAAMASNVELAARGPYGRPGSGHG
ncbi:hypothetical protein ACRE_055110 [Hapsidospora chrysogenum ATCC 11550]|uniref:Uncharacterized protein n=1 Tax=Hapsidospora chrysogenum (strain ATCC 11550 / CBS 779.69 / DSM 880 / IAM 14645 / JCM 23072 / IMI 49137) TaxID=857340 RepID=A0A086T2W5_HAPC1|nr:hypothetical protein ACRE_055110 [Hapsidospora chrysogenum ATCC 11550]